MGTRERRHSLTECTRETACRSCGGGTLLRILDLGATPLANRLLSPDDLARPEPRYPLELVFCPACTLVQIVHTVAPEVLFREYVYLSSVSDSLLAHSEEHANELIRRRSLGPESFVLELASNDGYLLGYFKERGVPVLGIEPAGNVAAVAREKGIPTLTAFFGPELAGRLYDEGLRADVVLGNNVLAHVADLNGFVAGAARLLAPDGVIELEFPYVRELVDRVEFDTIYHEHLCYFSAHAVDALFSRHGLSFTDVSLLPIHGGSLRVTADRDVDATGRARVEALLAEERDRGVDRADFYADFARRVDQVGRELRSTLVELKAGGARIAAYGAAAKGSTLLNYLRIGGDILEYVVDRSPVKQGKLMPGAHLEIVPPRRLVEDRPDYTLLLTWNLADEVLRQQSAYREAGGRFILPVPSVRIV